MIKLLKDQWWKYIGALLLLYALIGGMLVPLGPGIRSIYPVSIKSDTSVNFTITGYHTHFEETKDLQVLFKPTTSTEFYCADSVIPIINSTVRVVFHFPKKNLDTLHVKNFDLIVNDSIDGTMIMSYAAVVTAGSKDDSTSVKLAACTPREINKSKFQGFAFPYREILFQTIRNTFYHVPMWFTMMFLLIFSLVFSIRYLRTGDLQDDILASRAVIAALLFGVLGLATGMMWATYTWGSPWPNDVKLHGAAVGVMIYLAYIVLRGSLSDEIQRAKIGAVYNIFAIVIFVLFIFIIPRLKDSLHPGNGGNPAFGKYDLDNHLRIFFYPAIIGWTSLGFWIMSILVRMKLIEQKQSSL
jgi:heme exporter protein C